MLTPDQIPNNDNNMTDFMDQDRESFLNSSEDQVVGLFNEISKISDRSDTKRKYMIGLKAFYEFAVRTSETVDFADKDSFFLFTEIWFKAIENYAKNWEETSWTGLPTDVNVDTVLSVDNSEAVARYSERYNAHLHESLKPDHVISYAEKASFGLYELLIIGLKVLNFANPEAAEDFLDSFSEVLSDLTYDEAFL